MALVFTQTDLDNLKAALVTSATEVTIGDRTVRYRSQKEIMEAIRLVKTYLDGVSADVDDNPNVISPTYSRSGSSE
jgi:hypothetical protein